MLTTATRSGRPVHLWFRAEGLLFGAWAGKDGWLRAAAWHPDGRAESGLKGLDLPRPPQRGVLGERVLP